MLQPEGLTVEEAVELEGITRREVFRRMKPGDPHYLASFIQEGASGRKRRLINPASLSFEAQQRWRDRELSRAATQPCPARFDTSPPASAPSTSRGGRPPSETADTGQLALLPVTALDEKIVEARKKLSPSEFEAAYKRFKVIRPILDGDHKLYNCDTRTEYARVAARQLNRSIGTVWRLVMAYKKREQIEDLIIEKPGPERGTGTALERLDDLLRSRERDCVSMRAFLKEKYLEGNSSARCYRLLDAYLAEKRKAWAGGKIYETPSRSTVDRFLNSIGALDLAARDGADAIKAACGHIDRSYHGVKSLDRVDVDEWIVDVIAYDPEELVYRHGKKGGAIKVGRYYQLTFLDERSIYPLCWSLVEQPNEDDEIDLLTVLIREHGVPGLIHSDRGRFRGRTFGGGFLSSMREKMFEKRDGILDRLGIARNMGREHNPRGSRLERFHRQLADFCHSLPGWCGANTKERKISGVEALIIEHGEWVRGQSKNTPLLSRAELLDRLSGFIHEWRERSSGGTDMGGLAPSWVFRREMPEGGRRTISEAELDAITAERFAGRRILPGGIIQLPDGKRYSTEPLAPLAGQKRDVERIRRDHSSIDVLPAGKGENLIKAPLRIRVGVNDPAELARQTERLARLRKLTRSFAAPAGVSLDLEGFNEARETIPKAADAIPREDFFAAPDDPKEEETPAVGFADLE